MLEDRIAIVTGAGAGLGRSHAMCLARHGALVVVNDVAFEAADAVAEEIRGSGGRAIGVAASVTDEVQVKALVEQVVNTWGKIDILINNAGILRDKTFSKMSLADFRSVLEVHLMGSVICTHAVWDLMRDQRYGRIVMTTSSSGLFGNFGQSNYSAAKMAVVGLMQTLALEGEKYDIRVNALAPTAATQMTGGVLPAEILRYFDPSCVSPGLVALVGPDAPTRTILCAGAGHFSQAHISLTQGCWIGAGEGSAQQIADSMADIGNPDKSVVPAYGFDQFERELASARAQTS